MKAVILAAGIGSRIGNPRPKSLTLLPNNDTILGNQIKALRKNNITEIIVVVGFKKEFIMEEFPNLLYYYNPFYHLTNTSKSLAGAFSSFEPEDTVWLNGDVVLDEEVLAKVLKTEGNIIGVNKAKCAEEEIKYITNNNNFISQISKQVKDAEGEAVGVNKISKQDFSVFLDCLDKCADNDYFERGIEFAIERGVNFQPVDISEYRCIEVDFAEDLEKVRLIF